LVNDKMIAFLRKQNQSWGGWAGTTS
jgi:hypothetical protein